jgi:hypothetical protein
MTIQPEGRVKLSYNFIKTSTTVIPAAMRKHRLNSLDPECAAESRSFDKGRMPAQG